MFLLITVLILMIAILINRSTNNKRKFQSKTLESGFLVSCLLLFCWVIFDYFFLVENWLLLDNVKILPVFILAFMAALINIGIYSWNSKGSDYKPLEQAGVISDGCPYSGRWSIPANFFTHAAQVLWEELLFRGFIGLSIYFVFGTIPAVIVPSVLFSLVHYLPFRAFAIKNNIKPDRYVLGALITTGIFPAIFMILTIQFRSLIPAWIMHTFLNCSVGLYLRYILPIIEKKKYAY